MPTDVKKVIVDYDKFERKEHGKIKKQPPMSKKDFMTIYNT